MEAFNQERFKALESRVKALEESQQNGAQQIQENNDILTELLLCVKRLIQDIPHP